MKPRTFEIAGRRWRWKYRPMRSNYGLCDYTNRTITIDSSSSHSGRAMLDTEIHEALHALQCFASEEHTAEVAEALAGILHELGYRKTSPASGRGYLGE